jgi:hypothetical protein
MIGKFGFGSEITSVFDKKIKTSISRLDELLSNNIG